MEDIIRMLETSIEDQVISSSEKKALKRMISKQGLNERDFAFLRSKIFDIAKEHQEQTNTNNLINWIEAANKLTLITSFPKSKSSSVFFSPGDQCKNAIIQQIRLAKESLKICVFTISDNDISEAIESAYRKGVGIKIITDDDKSSDRGSDVQSLAKIGLKVKIDRSKSHMHHKFCVIDKETLITGSYNWTRSAAEQNQENIIISSEESVVKSYLSEFDKLWQELKEF